MNGRGWYFNQIKGTCEEVNEADLISCVEYDKTGEFLATGDRGGRIVIFQRDQKKCHARVNHNVYCTFVSHEPEFDYLKSLEIEEKINKIRWLPKTNNARFLLSTNDKTIKLWRMVERRKRVASDFNLIQDSSYVSNGHANGSSYNGELSADSPDSQTTPAGAAAHRFLRADDLQVPRFEDIEPTVEAIPRRIFANAHAYLINSLSVNSDQETFLSADDLRINLWNLQITDQSFNIVDIKPNNMEDLSEVITAAQFHPSACSLFVYSSSRGTIRLCDMRQRALCDQHAVAFEEDDPMSRSFFHEIINNISDLNFSHSGRYILSRDYLTVKVWDLNMSRQPVETYLVHDYFRTKLCSLYETDSIFDKFECQWSPDDRYILTGSYNNHFRVFDRTNQTSVLLEASREVMECSPDGRLPPCEVISPEEDLLAHQHPTSSQSEVNGDPMHQIHVESLDHTRKLLHLSWHPTVNCIALAGTSTLYLVDYLSPEDDEAVGGGGAASLCKTTTPPLLIPNRDVDPGEDCEMVSLDDVVTESGDFSTTA